MKTWSVLLTMTIALLLQAALARYTIGGRWHFDLVLVGVMYAALSGGAAAGLLAGLVGGLALDCLSTGIVGIGGLAKTWVGFLAGAFGSQFVVVKAPTRTAFVALATLLHRGILLGLQGLIDQQWPSVPWAAMLGETGLNALAGFIAFKATEVLPGAMERGRLSRRSTLGRRRW